ncbi:MAG: DUF3592 domain-containing protein [Bacteroidota bacterium]
MTFKWSLSRIALSAVVLTGFVLLLGNAWKQVCWEKTKGIVLEVKESKRSNNQYYPVVKYTDQLGKEVTSELSHQSSNRFYYEQGDSIPLLYHPQHADEVVIHSVGWMLGFPLIFVLLGGIGFLIPTEAWFASR